LPTHQVAATSAMTPLGARMTGGSSFAPSGSVAHVAFTQASNTPGGMSAAFSCSGTPLSQRALACSRVTVR